MRLKLLSDGTAFGTKIVDAKTGEELEYVTNIDYHASPHELPVMNLTVICPLAKVSGKAKINHGRWIPPRPRPKKG